MTRRVPWGSWSIITGWFGSSILGLMIVYSFVETLEKHKICWRWIHAAPWRQVFILWTSKLNGAMELSTTRDHFGCPRRSLFSKSFQVISVKDCLSGAVCRMPGTFILGGASLHRVSICSAYVPHITGRWHYPTFVLWQYGMS